MKPRMVKKLSRGLTLLICCASNRIPCEISIEISEECALWNLIGRLDIRETHLSPHADF